MYNGLDSKPKVLYIPHKKSYWGAGFDEIVDKNTVSFCVFSLCIYCERAKGH